MTARLRPATSAAVPLASAACAPWSAMARDAAAERVGGTEPVGDEALELGHALPHALRRLGQRGAEPRSDSVTRASAVTCCPICSTVLSSGRRSSAMWIAVAIWGQGAQRGEILGAVGVALGMVHLDRAQQVVAEPDRVDHRLPTSVIGTRTRADPSARPSPRHAVSPRWPPRRNGPAAFGRVAAVGPAEAPAIGQRGPAPSTTR